MNILMQTLKSLLLKCVEDIENESCALTDEELMEIMETLLKYTRRDIPMSKYQSYTYLNVSRATFDNYVREGKIPKGQKVLGYKELSWFKKDLNKFILESKKK